MEITIVLRSSPRKSPSLLEGEFYGFPRGCRRSLFEITSDKIPERRLLMGFDNEEHNVHNFGLDLKKLGALDLFFLAGHS